MRRAVATLAALLAFASPSAVSGGDSRAEYVVIVNAENPVGRIDRQFLAEAFLKKVTTWPSGEVIKPVDLAPSSPVRRQFTDDVLRRSIQEVKGYWQQRIFSGRDVPPPELDRESDVVAYVVKHEGAVGYVSKAAPIEGAKPVMVQ